jgi:hypothetical protein
MITPKQALKELCEAVEAYGYAIPEVIVRAKKVLNDPIELSLVYNYPCVEGGTNRGEVVLNGVHFANFWTHPSDDPVSFAGKICLNRSSKEAFKLPRDFPWFISHDEMLEWIHEKLTEVYIKEK